MLQTMRTAYWMDIRECWGQLGNRERLLLTAVAKRLLMGQKAYGELTPAKKKWRKEAAEEMLDGIIYIGAELVDAMEELPDGAHGPNRA